MTEGEITAGEVSRALDRFREDVHEDLDAFSQAMRDGFAENRRQIAGLRFVSVEVWSAGRETDQAALAVVAKQVEEIRTHARQSRLLAVSGLVFPVIVGVVTALILGALP